MPRISIGFPVHNGEAFLTEAMESLRSQTYRDLQVIITDNASTDRTEELCRAFTARDERITYHRNDVNIGAARNFNKSFELSDSEYFKWAAADDVCSPEYLERCVEVLDKDPSVVLCHSEVRFIDSRGTDLGAHDSRLENIDSRKVSERFKDLISLKHWCFDVFGLIRREVLSQTPLIGDHISSDRNLLAELGLRGRFHRLPDPLFFSREHEDRSIRAMELRERAEWFNPKLKGKTVFPHFRLLLEYLRSLWRVPLSLRDRAACHLDLADWILRSRRSLWRDVARAK